MIDAAIAAGVAGVATCVTHDRLVDGRDGIEIGLVGTIRRAGSAGGTVGVIARHHQAGVGRVP